MRGGGVGGEQLGREGVGSIELSGEKAVRGNKRQVACGSGTNKVSSDCKGRHSSCKKETLLSVDAGGPRWPLHCRSCIPGTGWGERLHHLPIHTIFPTVPPIAFRTIEETALARLWFQNWQVFKSERVRRLLLRSRQIVGGRLKERHSFYSQGALSESLEKSN